MVAARLGGRLQAWRFQLEDEDVQVGGDLVADAAAVANQVNDGPCQCHPEHQVLINEAVEVLVEEQQAWAQERQVMEVHLTLCHVGHHQLIGDLGRHEAKGQDVQTRVVLKELDRGLLVDHDG